MRSVPQTSRAAAEAADSTLKRAPRLPGGVAHASACRGELQFAVPTEE